MANGIGSRELLSRVGLDQQVDLASLLALITGAFGKDSVLLLPAIHAVSDHKAPVGLYFGTLYAASPALGWIAHKTVRKLGLDLRFKHLRFDNQWFYILTGEIQQFGQKRIDADLPDAVYLSAVVEQGKECVVYWGIVRDWTFDRSGNLDRIILVFAHRRSFQADRPKDSDEEADPSADARFYEIRGDYLSLRYADMKNINVDYFWLTPTTTPPEPKPAETDGGHVIAGSRPQALE